MSCCKTRNAASGLTAGAICGVWCLFLHDAPFLGRAYFSYRPGQFVIDVRMPSGTRLEVSNDTCQSARTSSAGVVKPADLDMIVPTSDVYPDALRIYTTNASMDTALFRSV